MTVKRQSVLVDALIIVVLFVFALACILPLINVAAVSFASLKDIVSGKFLLWPSEFDTQAYRYILKTGVFFTSLKNTVWITVVGTFINLAVTSMMAYVCSRPKFSGRRFVLGMVLITMLFNSGIIPSYLIVKETGLINTLWALVIPSAVSAFNLLVMREFFESIHESIIESATIDGCNDMGIFFRIILPLSKPALATFTLFYAVGNWNQFFAAVMYLNKPGLWPLQILLRQIVLAGQSDIYSNLANGEALPQPVTTQMATVVLASLPIVMAYPFLQKYFVKGITLGAVKG
ncbi:carbohydrate ABC transporter permease [Paenibacillus roseipurpureus]|uniref:Carbohydrate ABC transporter permease n=1 Tax=Paenibacillus roseopurpureus TaxID=2918901 RepID=A0AA96LPQ9_9BACL|nr:carbohydrate ABC transporter permease [Paenibacillus sp. MBLB1832]WNR45977.1 carbohydrate ABC transporter permease [Paenibacillus sp. MBLB1832]